MELRHLGTTVSVVAAWDCPDAGSTALLCALRLGVASRHVPRRAAGCRRLHMHRAHGRVRRPTAGAGGWRHRRHPPGPNPASRRSFILLLKLRRPSDLAEYLRAEAPADRPARSEEHTSELQSLMRNTYA